MKTVIFPLIDHDDFMEDKSYMIMFSATLFIITSFFSYHLIKLYSPELYAGVDRAFPIGLLSIFVLLFLSSLYFILFILIPFTWNIIDCIITFQIKCTRRINLRLKIAKLQTKTDFIYCSKFRGPLSTIMRC